jgi:hypothetical protein
MLREQAHSGLDNSPSRRRSAMEKQYETAAVAD